MKQISVAQAHKDQAWRTQDLYHSGKRVMAIALPAPFLLPILKVFVLKYMDGFETTVGGSEMLDVQDSEHAPASCPWGVIQVAGRPLPSVPIWRVEADKGAGFMVRRSDAFSMFLATEVLKIAYQMDVNGTVYYCFSDNAIWLALLWDYPPLADAYGVETQALEVRLTRHIPGFLESYTKEYEHERRED